MDKSIPQAFGEWVILECTASRVGEEVVSAGGIVTGVRKQGDIPLYGTVISCGFEVPENVSSQIMQKNVALPNGQISNVPDPRIAFGDMKADSTQCRIFVTCHYKSIKALYFYERAERTESAPTELEQIKPVSMLASATVDDMKKYL
ncbi:MAG: hypothetical protein ACRC3J_09235 [Culicoidibacterales bacterium]